MSQHLFFGILPIVKEISKDKTNSGGLPSAKNCLTAQAVTDKFMADVKRRLIYIQPQAVNLSKLLTCRG